MKKLTITFLGLMLFMFVPSIADAATSMTVSISCKDVTINKTTTCTVTGKASGGSISGVEGKYSINGGASISKFSVGSGWNGEGSGGSFSNYTDNNKSGTFTIGTFTVKGTKAGKVTLSLSSLLAFDSDFNEVRISNASRTFNVTEATTKPTTTKNPNAVTQKTTQPTTTVLTTAPVPLTLTSVRVDDFNVSYDGGVYYATVKPETDKVTISATAGGGITIVGTGQRNLAVGENAVDLVLRNQGGQTATFQLIITRPEGTIISDTKLTSLKVVGYDFAFSPDTKEYTVTVPSSLSEVFVEAKSYSDDVIITGAGTQTLKKGTNDVYVRVSYGELGSTEYKITIKRSYMNVFMWIIIGTLGAALVAMGIYANVNRKAAVSKAVAEKNKILAQNNRAEMNSAPQVQLNGESVVGTGKKAVAPTPVQTVVATPQPPVTPASPVVQASSAKPTVVPSTPQAQAVPSQDPQMIQTAPPAQVRVVKTTVVPVQQPAVQTVNTGATPGQTVVKTNTNKPVV
ncbi:MAG: hypothetical protein K2G03_04185 [Bacilli bacterium]|nr:hypothetical protein [Bacilli bacterium]MDE6141784.1 hypothetical protein [Bacilli bacterium]